MIHTYMYLNLQLMNKLLYMNTVNIEVYNSIVIDQLWQLQKQMIATRICPEWLP